MASTQELQQRLIDKLKELFELDQPDLDFGFYRIMHAKAEQVDAYLREGLPQTLKAALGEVNQELLAEYHRTYQDALAQAKDFGAPNPDEAPAVKKALQAYHALRDSAAAEADVYDHLYRFFSRYYDKGDFISRRYRVRETDSKAAPYAIPYNGEEVMLHWANADQYYIKSGEYFSNFSFDLAEAKELQGDLEIQSKVVHPLPVHFKVVDAEEGEHNNVKESDNLQRKFVPSAHKTVELNENGELVVNFECVFQKSTDYIYDAAEEKLLKKIYGTFNKGDLESIAAAHRIFEALDSLDGINPLYAELLKVRVDAAKTNPPLLARYYRRYAAKNTMDYFIHKDLGGFLRRELDFYIKNEVMHLDDIESADAPAVESYLRKLKAICRVAHDIIAFLAQLEDFQKKLWLKKKFVVETNYCLTLDRIPQEFYPEIAANPAQIREWESLFALRLKR